jgi:hypothetical protein
MSEAHAHDEYSIIEAFLPREFRFYRHYHIMSSFFAVFFIGLVFVAWVPFVMELFYQGVSDGSAFRAAAYATATFLFLVLLGRLGKREFDRTRFIVSLDGLIRRDPYRTVSVTWRDITGVRVRRIPGAKGALEITAPGAKIVLPSTILGFGQLCGAIQRGLERAGRAELLENGFLRVMEAMGTMSERWNERAKKAFWPIVAATVGTLSFNILVSSLVWETGTLSLIVWAGTTLPLPLLVYAVADFRLNRKFEKALRAGSNTAVKDDLAGELVFGFLIVAPVYGIFGIIARTIFLR